ncbi:MAG TPA: hypothetical protein VEV41_01600 [Terriglobales bacterium]|nr:hypothetical protein [Terriglobales bacterium]
MKPTLPNTVIQQSWKEYPDFADYLVELGFRRVVLGSVSAKFKSKYSLLWQAFSASLRLILPQRCFSNMRVVVAFGHFASVIKLLARLRLIHYEKLFCFAFFVHTTAWFRVFRKLARLDSPKDHYLIFSRSEMELYARKLEIHKTRMHYVPYGHWESAPPRPQLPAQL